MEKPTPSALQEAAGISQPYASMILNDGPAGRVPPRALAILLFRKLGWRHSVLDGVSDEDMAVFERHDPWVPPSQRADQERAA